MTTNQSPQRYCTSCGKPEHGSLACGYIAQMAEKWKDDPEFIAAQQEIEQGEKEYTLIRLAGIMVDCDHKLRKGKVCPLCGNTGRKLLFPGLRVDCSFDRGGAGRCQGRGWVPQPDGEKVRQEVGPWMIKGAWYGVSKYIVAAAKGDLPAALRAVEQACEEAGLLEKEAKP